MTPRLKSSIWVHALLRRCSGQGLFATVVRRGADEAGAIHVMINHLDGRYSLLSPAAGPAVSDDGERRFRLAFPGSAKLSDIDAVLAKEQRSDPDIWVVEVEDRSGHGGLTWCEE